MATPQILNLFLHLPLTILLLFPFDLSYAADSLTANQPLSGPENLVSQTDKFVLGFFQPGTSPYYYIGIWYSNTMFSDSGITPIWVANRETPIADPLTAELKISGDGNLVLSNQSNHLIWCTNTTITAKSTVAVLLDTGNLVLVDGSNPNITFWESFDHPTHTWIPGAKIGLNKVTGELIRLVSWKSSDDPSPGLFSLELDPNGTSQLFLLYNSSNNYWTSGTWNGRILSLVPEMFDNFNYFFTYVLNDVEQYYTYSLNTRNQFISRFIIDVEGQFKQITWLTDSQEWNLFWSQPRIQCDVHSLCGPFGSCNENASRPCNCIKGFSQKSPSEWNMSDWSDGCVRDTPLQCSKNSSSGVKQDIFYTVANVRFPDNSLNLNASSASDCELTCLNNCSCTAYSYGSTSGCSVWSGNLLNLQEQYDGYGGGTIFLRLAASELSHSGNNNGVGTSELPDSEISKGVIIGLVIGGVICSLILLIIVSLLIRRRRKGKQIINKQKTGESGLVAFRYSDLQRMTKNFSEKLGGGGFGTVFKGVLPDSTYIAVKKLEGVKQGEKQFWAEVRTIGTTQHVNLVRLHGFCSEGNKKVLVYEYMPNGSLQSQLFQTDTIKVMSWETRYQVALGMAQGLTYLHDHCRDCIIHCDIKPENILLDASFVPKIADFGLAKLMGRDFSRILTTMRGTIGYLAPEWISGSAITAKADVYSYGMMLFEIISGKRNVDTLEEGKPGFFPTLAATKLIEGDVAGLVDRRIAGDANLEEVTRLCKVACWCIQDHVNSRPQMRQVVQILEGILEVNMPPIPRILQILADHSGSMVVFSELPSNGSQQMEITSSSSETCTHL